MFDLKKIMGLVILSVVTNSAYATLTLPTSSLSLNFEREVREIAEPLDKVKLQRYQKQKLGQTEEDERHNQLVCSAKT